MVGTGWERGWVFNSRPQNRHRRPTTPPTLGAGLCLALHCWRGQQRLFWGFGGGQPPVAQLDFAPKPSDVPQVDSARGYNQLLDTFSLHQFMIRKGKVKKK